MGASPHKEQQQEARQLYRAAVSFTDYNVKRLMDELDTLGLADSTAIVFHGDHGWHLGEHGVWCKQSNFELVARVPLIVYVPWIPQSHGKKTAALVELVDLMPTTLDLMASKRVSTTLTSLRVYHFYHCLRNLTLLRMRGKMQRSRSTLDATELSQQARQTKAISCPGTTQQTTHVLKLRVPNSLPWASRCAHCNGATLSGCVGTAPA